MDRIWNFILENIKRPDLGNERICMALIGTNKWRGFQALSGEACDRTLTRPHTRKNVYTCDK